MNTKEILSGYLLKKKGDCYLTTDGKWRSFSNKTIEFDSLDEVTTIHKNNRGKTSIVAVYDVTTGNNGISLYQRVERIVK